jgi:hypothetical protein
MTASVQTARSAALPAIDSRLGVTALVAGALATIAFDLFGQGIAPALGLARLAPAGLAEGALGAVAGVSSAAAGEILHYLTGLVAYPLGWLLVARPLARALAPGFGWLVPAVAYGVVLWAFALYGVAHLVVGMPAFLGFGGITWVALAGHVLFALVAAGVAERRGA